MHDTQQLADLIAKKHECLYQLCELGRRQLELIACDDLAQLLRVLSAKQRLLVSLHEIQRALDPFRDQSPEDRQWPNASARDACAKLAAHSEQLLREIVEQEKQSESQLVKYRDDAAQRLQGFHSAAEARGAYIAESPIVASQLDLSSST